MAGAVEPLEDLYLSEDSETESKEEKRDTSIWNYSLTLQEPQEEKKEEKIEKIKKYLNDIAKQWCFQLEKGKTTENIHWQIQINLKNKKRQSELINELKTSILKGSHVSRTSRNGTKASFSYCMKEDTRMEGPWTNKDEEEPDEIKGIELRPFQKAIEEDCKIKCTDENRRKVNVLIDPVGGNGKSVIMKHLGFRKIAHILPHNLAGEKIPGYVNSKLEVDKRKHLAFIVDIPRSGATTKQITDTLKNVEKIKDGYSSDWRYKTSEKFFSNPKVWIFCNEQLPWKTLTDDRWKKWLISPATQKLIEFTEDRWKRIVEYADEEKKKAEKRKLEEVVDYDEFDDPNWKNKKQRTDKSLADLDESERKDNN